MFCAEDLRADKKNLFHCLVVEVEILDYLLRCGPCSARPVDPCLCLAFTLTGAGKEVASKDGASRYSRDQLQLPILGVSKGSFGLTIRLAIIPHGCEETCR